jgi:hypothetical protein
VPDSTTHDQHRARLETARGGGAAAGPQAGVPDGGRIGGRRPRAADLDAAPRLFSISILISATRCLVTYVFLPFLAPLMGIRAGVGPALGLVIGVVAIAANVASIRRFWAHRHPWRWPISIANAAVILLLLAFMVIDLADLLA